MEITPEIVQELLHYDPETGVFTWRERGRHWFKDEQQFLAWNANYAGKRAGTTWTSPQGYQARQINLGRKIRKEHRLAWMWMTGEHPPPQIDHRNRIATDNRWDNLRRSSHSENRRNTSKRRDNTSGQTGVCWHAASGRWHAVCTINGKAHSVGYFDDCQEAGEAVRDYRIRHGFDPLHGAERAHYA